MAKVAGASMSPSSKVKNVMIAFYGLFKTHSDWISSMVHSFDILWILLAWFVSGSSQASSEDWKSRSIYQVVTDRFARSDGSTTHSCDPGLGEYCGGTWRGLTNSLDYIQGMGFSAIWISPVTLNLQERTAGLSSYHGYWQQDLYALNQEFGDTYDLKALSDALHERKMYLMIDVVVGNMASSSSPSDVDYSIFNPFNSQESFHPYCAMGSPDNLTSVQECWIGDGVVSLPDLRTEDETVAGTIYSWVNSLVHNYSVDALRIDSVANLNPEFLPGLEEAAGVYCLGEVIQTNGTQACASYSELLTGFLNYPVYYSLVEAFRNSSGTMSSLVDQLDSINSTCKDPMSLGIFSENHDVPRFASYTPDMSLAQNILAYNMLGEGIPVLYYGQEQHFDGSFNPINREALWLTGYNTTSTLYLLVWTLLSLRAHAISSNHTYLDYASRLLYSDDHIMVLRKGFVGNQIISVLTNNGADSSNRTITITDTGLAEDEVVFDVLSCDKFAAGQDGEFSVTIIQGLPRVFYPYAALGKQGSCFCMSDTGTASNQNKCDHKRPNSISFAISLVQQPRERYKYLLLPCLVLYTTYMIV